MKLSKNFDLQEFTASAKAKAKGISNEPTPEALQNLTDLVQCLLQPIRDMIGRSFTITSGYRSPELNAAVGGVKTSQHNKGQAVDFVVQGMSPLDVCHLIRATGLEFDQLIYEQTWVHLSYVKDKNRKQILTATFTNGVAKYTPGLPE